MDVNLHINDVLRADLKVVRLMRSYVRPWSCELAFSGRHDPAGGVPCRLYDWVIVRDAATGAPLFRGNITQLEPGGVGQEGIVYIAQGRRFQLENEMVRINGSTFYVWNRRGHLCNYLIGEDSPGQDGGPWTAGEIAVDILEHALGIPAAGSDIAGHHSCSGCVTDTYLNAEDITGYVASEWLALDTVIGEFGVNETPLAQALDELVTMAGGFYGWYIDASGVLRLHDLNSLPQTDIKAGELGHWQDEGGADYKLLDNVLDWNLDGVYSTVVVQGTDLTVEVKPSNIEGSANPALNGGGELELIAAPWMGWTRAYRTCEQPYRLWTKKSVGWNGSCADPAPGPECGVPDNVISIVHLPRIYRGTDAGAKTYLVRPFGGTLWRISFASGIVTFEWTPTLGPGEKLWGWYWARRPFTATAGPEGNAYDCLGYERTLYIHDPLFKHPTSYPTEGTADDEIAMQLLADRMLEQVRDIRVQGRLECDEVDPLVLDLTRRFNVIHLTPPGGTTSIETTTTEAPCTTTAAPCWPDPLDWEMLALNAVEIVYDFELNTTEISAANTFHMLEGYSELRRRLKMNEFRSRELALSEDVLDCQVQSSSEPGEANYSTSVPPPPTTEPPPPTTAPPEPTTTGPPPPTTTTTTTWCEDCRDLADLCFLLSFNGRCKIDFTGVTATMVRWASSWLDPAGWMCSWRGIIPPPKQAGTIVTLKYHPTVGWMVLHGSRIWFKDDNKMDFCEPTGTYTCYVCAWDPAHCGTVVVTQVPCGTTTSTTAAPGPTEAPTTSTTAAPTTTTTEPPTTSTTAAPTTTTTTEAPEGCPEDCSSCTSPYFCDAWVGMCAGEECDGLYTMVWNPPNDCEWWSWDMAHGGDFDGDGACNGFIICESDPEPHWYLEFRDDNDFFKCGYEKPLSACPAGNYTIVVDECTDCEETQTVYS